MSIYDKSTPGCVYLISTDNYAPCGYFKIGITRRPKYEDRIKQIQDMSPFFILTVRVVGHSLPEHLEQEFLKKFRRHRVRGEWLYLGDRYVNEFDGCMFKACKAFENEATEFLDKNCDGGVVV